MRCCRCCISLGRRCRRRYACGGEHGVAISTVPSSSERTNERTNFSLLSFCLSRRCFSSAYRTLFSLSLARDFFLSLLSHLSILRSFFLPDAREDTNYSVSDHRRRREMVLRQARSAATMHLTDSALPTLGSRAARTTTRPMPDYGGRTNRFDARPAAAAAAAVRCASAHHQPVSPLRRLDRPRARERARARFLSILSRALSRSLISPACPCWKAGTRARSDRSRNRYVVTIDDTPDNRVGR